jgi:amino acid efflux transporter
MNVYISGTAKLAAALGLEGALPRWLAGDAHLSVPRRPLAAISVVVVVILVGLVAGVGSTSDLVRATSACFIAVYLLALGSAFRILTGRIRVVAAIAVATIALLAVFSYWFLFVPAVAAAISLALQRRLSRGAHREQLAFQSRP